MFPPANLNYFTQYTKTERNPKSNKEFAMQKSVTIRKPQSRHSYSIWASSTQNIVNLMIYKRILPTSELMALFIHIA